MSAQHTLCRSRSATRPSRPKSTWHSYARRRVVHPHGRRAPAGPAALHREARQRPVRDHDASPGEQDADLHHGEVLGQPVLDAVLLGQQRSPRRAVAVGAMRAHPLEDLADQLVGELLLATAAVDPELDRGGDVAPWRLAVDADPLGDRPLAVTFQPAPQRLFDLDHRYLPERHGASSSETQPSDSSAGVGGPSGWSHDWQRGWSHATGKTSGYLVPCGWQTTPCGGLRPALTALARMCRCHQICHHFVRERRRIRHNSVRRVGRRATRKPPLTSTFLRL